jgi:hypothetical protein
MLTSALRLRIKEMISNYARQIQMFEYSIRGSQYHVVIKLDNWREISNCKFSSSSTLRSVDGKYLPTVGWRLSGSKISLFLDRITLKVEELESITIHQWTRRNIPEVLNSRESCRTIPHRQRTKITEFYKGLFGATWRDEVLGRSRRRRRIKLKYILEKYVVD